MGAFVVTNTIRTLSDVFVTPVDSLNEFGAAGPVPHPDMQKIGRVFRLKRFVLVAPDIPAEALLSNRGNFLASALSRFDEAYLFSNEGDEVLRQISTLANYFVFPTKKETAAYFREVEKASRQGGDDALLFAPAAAVRLPSAWPPAECARRIFRGNFIAATDLPAGLPGL
jgi:hypothetical protein